MLSASYMVGVFKLGVRKEGLGDGLGEAMGRKEYTSPAYKLDATQDCRGKPLAASEAWKSQVLVTANR